jgi:hypothetical protein
MTTIMNPTAIAKAAIASPGIAIDKGLIYVANISATGYLYVTVIDGLKVTSANVSTLNGMPKLTGSGYALAQSVTSTPEGPAVVMRFGSDISLFTYSATFRTWNGIDISGWARWTLGSSATFSGNPVLAGEGKVAIYARTTRSHLIELLPQTSNDGAWVTDDLTATYATLTPKSDVVVFGSSARQLAVVVGSNMVVLSANGPVSEPWIPVTVSLSGAKALFTYGSGSLGATLQSMLATFTA